MRTILGGLAVGALIVTGASAGAQEAAPAHTAFSGVKLVDLKARTPEQSVTLVFGRNSLRIVAEGSNTAIRTLEYDGLRATHSVSSAPPASAGEPSAAATGAATMPMYFGKTPRNWLSFEASGEIVTLRVSSKVYDQVKAALAERQVRVDEAR
jgi:hypothetical protein